MSLGGGFGQVWRVRPSLGGHSSLAVSVVSCGESVRGAARGLGSASQRGLGMGFWFDHGERCISALGELGVERCADAGMIYIPLGPLHHFSRRCPWPLW